MGRKKGPKGWVFEEELDVEPDDALESGRPRPGAVLSAERLLCPVCGDTATPAGQDAAYARCSGCGSWLHSASFRGQGGVRGHARPRAFSLPHPLERRELRRHAVEVMRGFFGIRKGRRAALNAFGLDVLELGCGPGVRLQAFEDYGWTAGVALIGQIKETLAVDLHIVFENEEVSIPRDRELISQVHSIKKTATDAGYSRYDTEKNEKHHADRFWALALAVHAAGIARGRKRRRRVVSASIV